MMKFLMTVIIAALLSFSTFAVTADDHGDLAKQLAKAEKLYAEAEKRGFAWTTTEGVISKAKEALAANNMDAAKDLIKQAMIEAKASIDQADESDKNWQANIPN